MKENKVRCTYTIDPQVERELEKVCRVLKVKKSAFVESVLKESLKSTQILFSPDENLGTAIFSLTKELNSVKEMLSTDNDLLQNKIKEIKDGFKGAEK